MDSLSQIVLGAAVGEAFVGKKIGNKALLWGAIMGTIPDLDVLIRPFISDVQELTHHRSLSHSVLFFILLALAFGWLLRKVFPSSSVTFKDWTLLSFWCFVTHSLLDCFTTWGTALFWPFPTRVAWQSIFVIDPLYTIPFLILLIILMFYDKTDVKRRQLNTIALILSTAYLLFTLGNKVYMNKQFTQAANEQHIKYTRIETRPAPLQNILWTANVETKNGFYLAYYSWFDKKPIQFNYFKKNHALLSKINENSDIETLKEMSKNLYTIEQISETEFIFNDLRFGQLDGWADNNSPFVFAYKIKQVGDNIIINKIDVAKEAKTKRKSISSILSSIWKRI